MKALSFELEYNPERADKVEGIKFRAPEIKLLYCQIIDEVRSSTSFSALISPQTSSPLNSLQMEHDQLKLNLK